MNILSNWNHKIPSNEKFNSYIKCMYLASKIYKGDPFMYSWYRTFILYMCTYKYAQIYYPGIPIYVDKVDTIIPTYHVYILLGDLRIYMDAAPAEESLNCNIIDILTDTDISDKMHILFEKQPIIKKMYDVGNLSGIFSKLDTDVSKHVLVPYLINMMILTDLQSS